ncbi:TPA: cyclic-guanylate-specific phosphodiesterase PdeF [Escherichia coli]|nr:cyclic-guanylate-specific phosphodiesterase PdeF [Escherichia coli]
MKLNATYIKIRDKWWGLPLFLPSLILPIFAHINTFAHISSGEVFLFYLPLALMISMMMFFSWAALPGIALGIFVRKYAELGFYETLSLTANFIIIIILCWGGYRVFTPRRNNVSHGDTRLISQRIFWQIVFPATLFLILFQFAAFVGLLASRENLVGVMPFNLGTLINYQALLVGNLIGVPLCYFIIRVVRNPFYLRSYYSQLKQQVDVKVTKKEFALWLLALGALLLLLCMPLNEKSTIFSTNYTLSLLLPLMMWGAMRYGYKLISLLWAVVLMISIHSYQNYIPIYPGYTTQLTIASSSYLVFSFIVNYMAVLATRQRAVVRRIQRLAYVDPVVHLPNVRALNRALRDAPWSALCYLRIPGMEMLVKNYGIMLRIQYKQKLSHWLSPLLEPGEDVYQLSGNDLALRLNTESHQERIAALDSHLKQFRFFWDGMPMQPQIGVSYCYVRSPVNHIYLLLGELNTVAELSIVTNAPENMQRRGAMYLQRELKDKVAMMNRLQQALEHNHFFLMAQPITGMRGDVYHEILLRMKGENDELIGPDSFLPVAHEFGLSSSIDMWVIEHTLQFMAENRAKMPAHRFAINLSPTSVCQARFPVEVSQLLAKYQIEAWQLIFEVTESNALTNVKQAQITLQHLQELGCQIAIDDFGTGYASYARLKNVNADLLKIDGSFIRNIVSNSLDYQIVASICHLARMKKMRVVAEYVENEEIREAVLSLGIDYMQGYLIGKPQPLIDTLNEIEPIRESA